MMALPTTLVTYSHECIHEELSSHLRQAYLPDLQERDLQKRVMSISWPFETGLKGKL